ncbi:hypothetical protein [Glaciimonas sp. PCH181]|uniref:hypothetical protein n=1 Tax=Glaciimonas sp. PCH181 TaxID=2133943 RepID=UPI000D338F3B|nr:hypothetical protein [Glaciimonas sp. PCH181]PUA17313.1 hypothetical protein C7W93_15410 [Glaciimonas sp. PCH181]
MTKEQTQEIKARLRSPETAIPPMTDPLGKHWRQPRRETISLDDTHALMDASSFAQLADYSSTHPSGVYPGKMWKRHDGLFDRRCKTEDRVWLLCWFGECDDPTKCSNNYRQILVA